jgi:hypothetical protein
MATVCPQVFAVEGDFTAGLSTRPFAPTVRGDATDDESVGFRRTAGPSRIIRERWRRQLGRRFIDGRDDAPLGFHFISAREKCNIC